MACVIYRGTEKLFVDPVALNDMLAQGWSLEPDALAPAPSAEDYAEFLNLHEELKRLSDQALSLRDDQIAGLQLTLDQLDGEIDILKAENLELKEQLKNALEELAPLQKVEALEVDENQEQKPKVAHLDYSRMTYQQLSEHAKRAKITNIKNKRKAELINALQLWEMQNGPATKD